MIIQSRVVICTGLVLAMFSTAAAYAGKDSTVRRDVAHDDIEDMAVPGSKSSGEMRYQETDRYLDNYDEMEEETESEYPNTQRRGRGALPK